MSPGRRLRCIHPDGTWLVRGHDYTVVEQWDSGLRDKDGRVVYHVGLNLFPGIIWGTWRFEELPA